MRKIFHFYFSSFALGFEKCTTQRKFLVVREIGLLCKIYKKIWYKKFFRVYFLFYFMFGLEKCTRLLLTPYEQRWCHRPSKNWCAFSFCEEKSQKKDHLNIPTIFITLNSCHFHRIPNKKPQNWFPTILVSWITSQLVRCVNQLNV